MATMELEKEFQAEEEVAIVTTQNPYNECVQDNARKKKKKKLKKKEKKKVKRRKDKEENRKALRKINNGKQKTLSSHNKKEGKGGHRQFEDLLHEIGLFPKSSPIPNYISLIDHHNW